MSLSHFWLDSGRFRSFLAGFGWFQVVSGGFCGCGWFQVLSITFSTLQANQGQQASLCPGSVKQNWLVNDNDQILQYLHLAFLEQLRKVLVHIFVEC